MRHKIGEFPSAIPRLKVKVMAHPSGGSLLYTHPYMKASTLITVLGPPHKLGITQVSFGFCNGSSSDAVEDELVPDLFAFGEPLFFPRPFTSPIADRRARVNP